MGLLSAVCSIFAAEMARMNRRQWLIRAGSLPLLSTALTGCREEAKRPAVFIGSRLTASYEPLSPNGCTDCENCMPCPYGIDIPGNLTFVDGARAEGFLPDKIDDDDFASKGRIFLRYFESRLSDPAQSQHCIGCDECLGTCPVGIAIPDRLAEISALTDVLRDIRSLEV